MLDDAAGKSSLEQHTPIPLQNTQVVDSIAPRGYKRNEIFKESSC